MVTLAEFIRWIAYSVAAGYRAVAMWLLRRDQIVAGSERRFRALLESAPDAMIIVNWHGHITLLNGEAERLFGYAREDIVGQNMTDLLVRRYRDSHRELQKRFQQETAASTTRAHRELLGLHRDGREFPIDMSLSPMITDRGPLLFVAIRDITDRKRAEGALREAEERFRTAFEDAPVGIAVGGLGGELLQVNRAMCEITGRGRAELEAMTFPDLTDPVAGADDAEQIRQLVAGAGSHYRVERELLHSDGHLVPADLSVAVVRDAEGNPSRLIYQANDITERKRFEATLQQLADHDELTGMFNRRRFEQELSLELERASRFGSEGAVLAVDIDHFKHVNDTLGHSVGDDLIVRVGELFRGRLRSGDIMARLGGDEFAVILPGIRRADAVAVAESLLGVLHDECRLEMVTGPPRRVTASIGVAPFGSSACDAESVLVEADIAMYDAKEAGRDQVRVYDADEDRQRSMQAGLTWGDRIRDALEHDGFVLYAQPIAALKQDPVARYELLLRMLGDDGRPVPPASFLPIAERSDLILQIDRWVLGQAVELLAAERKAGRQVHLAVNLSAKSVTDPELPDVLAERLRAAGIDGTGLCLEMTETAAIVNVERAKNFAKVVAGLGCEFALDDFGSGFASFYYLKHMAFDYIKIDGEFIRDLTTTPANQLVVKSLVDIAAGMGQRTIAEFVENAETLELLEQYGIDFAQGYHVGRPVPLSETPLGATGDRHAVTGDDLIEIEIAPVEMEPGAPVAGRGSGAAR